MELRRREKSKSGPGRSEIGPRRPTVTTFDDDPGPWDDDTGTAGVREPRHPKPNPLSAAGELPEPQPMTYLVMSDPRR